MRAQLLFVLIVLIVLIVLAGFAALKWTALATPAPLNFLVARIEAPPGLVMLGRSARTKPLPSALQRALRSGREAMSDFLDTRRGTIGSVSWNAA